jgi:glycosyltransferase involved in cell wall biosynthesis
MKVLLIYYEPRPSGQTTHVLSLVRGLDPERYQLTVVMPECLTPAALEQHSARVIPFRMGKTLWPAQEVVALIRLIHREDFDIVHVHSQEAGLLGRVVARLAGSRAIVYTPQTIDIRRIRFRRLYVLLEWALAHITRRIVSVNELDRQRLIRWHVPAHKVVTVPNGIDLNRFREPIDSETLRRSFGLSPEYPLVMQVGRLSAQKDPEAFVEGAAQVLRVVPDAQFALVGDGPLSGQVADRIRHLGLEQQVHLLGWQDEAFRLLAAADVVSLTSRWEGAPYALLEAMAWSKPVVATSVNGCPEIVAHGISGLLVPPGDTAAWALAVTRLLQDRAEATAMGQEGRKRLEARFALPRMIASIEGVYRDVIPPQVRSTGRF